MESTQAKPPAGTRPSPLPYQQEMVRFLKSEERELWKWFSSSRTQPEHAEAIRLELLKSTYRLEPTTQPRLYALADEVLASFGLEVPVTFYQAQTGSGMNAGLAYVPQEVHLVLTGPILTALSETELHALLGHELAHYLLFQEWDREFFVASELLHALQNDAGAASAHLESARLFRLYAEVFADRGSLAVTGDVQCTVAALLKTETGLTEVSADSYLRQADEIFSKGGVQANQPTHPESYIRARALALWAERGDQALGEIERMIEGPLCLGRLDLLGQKKVAETTRRLLAQLLGPRWFQSEPILAHARLFFDDFVVGNGTLDEPALAGELQSGDAALQDYYCYVLLDFATVDRDLAEVALAAALVLSKRLGLSEAFSEIALKELALSKKQLARIEREADETLAKANEAASPA